MESNREIYVKTSGITVAMIGDIDIGSRISLAREIEKFGVKVCFISPKLKEDNTNDFSDHYEYNLYVGLNLWRLFKSILSLRRALRDSKANLYHTFDTKPGLLTVLAALPRSRKTILRTITGCGSWMAEDSNDLLKSIYVIAQRLACKNTAYTVFQNPDDRDEFVSRRICSSNASAVILGSGVDESKFFRSQNRTLPIGFKHTRDEELKFVCISRMLSSKGVVSYLNAAREVLAEFPYVHFYLVGPLCAASSDALDLQLINSYSSVVTYLGERADIVDILEHTNVSVLPSRYREGIPRVLLEAGFMNHVIITADRPGCREVVFDGANGILIDPTNESELVEAFKTVIVEYEKFAAGVINILPQFRDLFSVSAIGDQYISTYRKINDVAR